MTMVCHGFTLFLVFLATLTTFLSHDPEITNSLYLFYLSPLYLIFLVEQHRRSKRNNKTGGSSYHTTRASKSAKTSSSLSSDTSFSRAPLLSPASATLSLAASAETEKENVKPDASAQSSSAKTSLVPTKQKSKRGFGASKSFALPEDVHCYSNQALRVHGIVAGHTHAIHDALGGIKPGLVLQMAQGKAQGVRPIPLNSLPPRFGGKVAIGILLTESTKLAIVDSLQYMCNSSGSAWTTAARFSALMKSMRTDYGATMITMGASRMPVNGPLTNANRRTLVVVFPVSTPEEVASLYKSDGYAKGEILRMCLHPKCMAELDLGLDNKSVSSEFCPTHRSPNEGKVCQHTMKHFVA